MKETRRRVSRARRIGNEEFDDEKLRKERKPQEKFNSASFSKKVFEFLDKKLMRGLFDESDNETTPGPSVKQSKSIGRFLNEPHTSEDVLANEGDGSHMPFIYPYRKDSTDKPRQTFTIEGPNEERKSTVKKNFYIKFQKFLSNLLFFKYYFFSLFCFDHFHGV